MTTRRGTIALAWTLLLAATGAAAQAEDPAAKARARQHFEDGVALFAGDRYPAALAEFMLSYQARPKTSVLYNIAMCQKAVGDYPAAIATFERYLAENGHKGDAAQRAEIEALVREMRSDLGRIRIAGAPEGTRVRVDGVEIALRDGRGSLEVAPGSHRVLIDSGGGKTEERLVVVARGAESVIDLAPPPPPAPSPEPAKPPPRAEARPVPPGPAPPPAPKPTTASGEPKEAAEMDGPDPARGARVSFAMFLPAAGIIGIFTAAIASTGNTEATTGMGVASGALGFAALISAIVWGAKASAAKEEKKEVDVNALLDPATGTAGLALGRRF